MKKIQALMYAPFIANTRQTGAHIHLSLDEQWVKLKARMKSRRFEKIAESWEHGGTVELDPTPAQAKANGDFYRINHGGDLEDNRVSIYTRLFEL